MCERRLTCDGLPVLRIQRLIDLVEQIERRRIALLDREDERQRHEGFLSAAQLLHVPHLSTVTTERHLRNNQSHDVKRV